MANNAHKLGGASRRGGFTTFKNKFGNLYWPERSPAYGYGLHSQAYSAMRLGVDRLSIYAIFWLIESAILEYGAANKTRIILPGPRANHTR